jgi:hypothetical protein
MDNEDPLEQVYVKIEQVEGDQRRLLAKIILPLASIEPEQGTVYFKQIDNLNAKRKVLLYLLCRLALASRPNTAFAPTVSPKEIEKATRMSGGTVRPKLAELQQEHLIQKSGDGYFVSPHDLPRIYGEFEEYIPQSSDEK